MNKKYYILSFFLAFIYFTNSIKAENFDIEYGEFLANECSACHSLHNDIPPIQGIDKEYFLEAMAEYKSRERENAAMHSVAKSLDGFATHSLAAYLSSLEPW